MSNVGVNPLKISKRVAAVLIVVGIAGSIVTMSVEAFRVRFFNMVIETTERFSLVSQEENGTIAVDYEVPSDWVNYFYPTFIPEDYSLKNTRVLNETKIMVFTNVLNHEIRFSQTNISTQAQIDSENAKVIEVEINEHKGMKMKKS